MKLHTNRIEVGDLLAAARVAGVTIEGSSKVGSRSHSHAFEVYLSGSSNRYSNNRDHKAATWDEWGVFMGELYKRDEGAVWGSKSWGYRSAEDFHAKTCDRFRDGMPMDTHVQHKWVYDYADSRPWSGQRVFNCNRCSAQRT